MQLHSLYKGKKFREVINVSGYNVLNVNDKIIYCLSLIQLQKFSEAEEKLLRLSSQQPNTPLILEALATASAGTKNFAVLSKTLSELATIKVDPSLLIVAKLIDHMSASPTIISGLLSRIDTLGNWLIIVPLLSPYIGSAQLRALRRSSLTERDKDRLICTILFERNKSAAFEKALSKSLLASRAQEIFLAQLLQIKTESDPNSAISFLVQYMQAHGLRHENFDENVLNNICLTFQRMGEYEVAEKVAELFIETTTDYRKLNNIALVYSANKKPHAAEKLFLRIIEEHDAPFEAVANLANFYKKYTLYSKAKKYYQLAIEKDPSKFRVKLNYSSYLIELGEISEAISVLLGLLKNESVSESVAYTARNNMKFALNYYPEITDDELLKFYNPNGKKSEKGRIRLTDKDVRLRVGLVSGDFKSHSVLSYLDGFFELEKYFDLFIVSNVTKKDADTTIIRNRFGARFIDIAGIETVIAVESVRALDLHVAIDLSGVTSSNRLDIFKARIAQVQASALGFNFSTGFTFVDYLITQEGFYSPSEEERIAENILPMSTPLPIRSRDYAVHQGPISSGKKRIVCCSRAIRINDGLIRCWRDVSTATGCVVEINSADFRSEEARNNFYSRYESYSVRDFIELGYESPIEKVYCRADLTLDCFPHNSGTTLYESLLCGVPFITMHNRVSVGRFGGFLANACGHSEWIAYSEDEYVIKVIEFLKSSDSFDRLKLAETARAVLTDTQGWGAELAGHFVGLVDSDPKLIGLVE